MKLTCIILWVIGLFLGAAQGQRAPNIFNPREISAFLADEDYVLKQINCILGRASCDATGRQLKVAIPEVIVRDCRNCSPQQAAAARQVVNFIRKTYPREWSQIQARYRRG